MKKEQPIPTPEQQAIIDAVRGGQNILVSALAGTGKTTTLRMIAQNYPHQRGLYLAYNKKLREDANAVFPEHIVCKTIHALAYQAVGRPYHSQLSFKLQALRVAEYFEIQPLTRKDQWISGLMIAAAAIETIRVFCYAVSPQILPEFYSRPHVKQIMGRYPTEQWDIEQVHHPKTLIEEFIRCSLDVAQQLWQAMIDVDNESVPMTHDGYLKLYHMQSPVLHGFDYIMLDEAQDANPIILDLLEQQHVQKIYVGDTYQQIYGYRGTKDAMNQLDGIKLSLTQSFRFGQNIADEANKVLAMLNTDLRIKGHPDIPSQVTEVEFKKPYTLIARGNAEIFREILSLAKLKKKVCFVGFIDQVLKTFESAYYLFKGQRSKIRDEGLHQFPTWDAFKGEALQNQEQDYLSILRFIEEYKNSTLKIIDIIKKTSASTEDEADVIVTTAHKAKGRQWRQVILHGDFKESPQEELNIIYVAMTRATHILELSPKFILNTLNKPHDDADSNSQPTKIKKKRRSRFMPPED